eukprot:CAMPEP_0185278418 /NCGR_PEP_ID=MMETSP1359-20130426/61016_1 /TAXON_ID=552665 /ORGANISM="Bigelowiella longifila, Strain CCMP242" /LENGTH=90 /DNA_ID=CAMNT_0027872917 /DNA_START=483 /DNA_END=754 /DNA_ORIENTATION=-
MIATSGSSFENDDDEEEEGVSAAAAAKALEVAIISGTRNDSSISIHGVARFSMEQSIASCRGARKQHLQQTDRKIWSPRVKTICGSTREI